MTAPVGGSLARTFDFEDGQANRGGRSGLRLAPAASGQLRGPDKYKVLAHRLHQAQIKARRLLALADEAGS